MKLATELSRRSTSLAFDDVAALLRVLQRLVDAGNLTVARLDGDSIL